MREIVVTALHCISATCNDKQTLFSLNTVHQLNFKHEMQFHNFLLDCFRQKHAEHYNSFSLLTILEEAETLIVILF